MDALHLLLLALLLALAWRSLRLQSHVHALHRSLQRRNDELASARAENARQHHKSRQRDAFFHATSHVGFDGMLLLDSECRVIQVNQALAQLLGEGDLRGKAISDLPATSVLNDLARQALQSPESLEEQFTIGETHFRARALAWPSDPSDPIASRVLAVALQDISDLVHLSRARRDLVANISHELRTPITRIRLIIDGLFLDDDKPKRKASIQSLKEIALETDSLLWLAQELLDLSMIESGQAIMRLVEMPLKRPVNEAIERLQSHAELKDLSLVSHVPQQFQVLCDVEQLKRVIGNLLHNAIKWSPASEVITVTAVEHGDEVVLTVFDNGPGVPESARERIFERFYQADVSRSADVGTGLGLAICKHIVEAHGGRIWAEGNSHGKGGQFAFTLLKAGNGATPATATEQAMAPAPQPATNSP